MIESSSDYINDFKKAADEFKLFEFGDFDGKPICSFFRLIKDAPRVLITASIHGDEKAGPLGLYSFMVNKKYPSDLSVIIVPIINRYGFDNNKRRNEQDRDLNRAFNKKLKNDSTNVIERFVLKVKPDIVLNLHEDGVHEGAYIYVPYDDMAEDANLILKNVSRFMKRQPSKTIFKDDSDHGVIITDPNDDRPKNKSTFESFLTHNSIPYYTFETSKKYDMKLRAAAQLAAIYSLLG